MSTNGYVILDRKPANGLGEIILCELPGNAVTPWVTWVYYRDGKTGRMVRADGNYFYAEQGFEAAKHDFNRRT